MRTEVVIWNGKTKITLWPENDFEKEVIQKAKDFETKVDVAADREYTYGYHEWKNHKIEIDLTTKKQLTKK